VAPDIAYPAAAVDVLLQSVEYDGMTRVDVFSQIYLVFLALGTLVGTVVVTYTLYKVYKYRAGADHEYDVGRPQLGELPTGADKGGRKLFLSFSLSAIIVISLIAWTYGLLLYVETGGAEVPEDGVEVEVVGDNFAWEFEYTDSETIPRDQLNDTVGVIGQQETAAALREARSNGSMSYSAALAARMDAASNDSVAPADVTTNVGTIGTMRIPVDREIHIEATSGDVWHNFGMP
jgi:cytochrome c oxidase subunit 2